MKEEELHEELFSSEKRKTDYKTIVADYLLRWPVIAASLALALAAAHVWLRYQPPVYAVSSTVMIKQGDKTKAG